MYATLLGTLLAVSFAPATTSPAAAALSAGQLERALDLPAQDDHEATWIEAQVHLASGRVAEAEALARTLPEGDGRLLELLWRIARAQAEPEAVARAAQAYCAHGDPTLRACADAELFGEASAGSRTVELAGEVSLPLAKGAPFPVTLGRASGQVGAWIVDTGASETVLAAGAAEKLGLEPTDAAFPVGVAGGGRVVQARLAMLPVLELGEARVKHLPVLVMDMPQLEKQGIHGILSPQQALAGLEVHLDFAAHALRLREGGGASPDGVTVPYYAAGEDLAVQARVGDGPVALFGLDTGMEGACAVATDYESGLARQGEAKVAGAGAAMTTARLQRASVALGAEDLGSGDCIESPMHKQGIRLAGLLGNALWGGGSLTLDTVKRTVTVQPPKGGRPGSN